eukprot:9191671-Lingulodinium_polyedra.AAC.1
MTTGAIPVMLPLQIADLCEHRLAPNTKPPLPDRIAQQGCPTDADGLQALGEPSFHATLGRLIELLGNCRTFAVGGPAISQKR